MKNSPGILYVVATPIGNLEDFTLRAARILSEVDLILAEDTRHSRKLLNHYRITTAMKSFHEYNEREFIPAIMEMLQKGKQIALISDAGTPLISDPGFPLLDNALNEGFRVVPVPGPSAIITALSVGGISTAGFVFEGFAPEKRTARQKFLKSLSYETRTIVLYEVPHRIIAFLEDATDIFGRDRVVTLARELTKKFESVYRDTLGNLLEQMKADNIIIKGEFVVLISGAGKRDPAENHESDRILGILLEHSLPVREAVAITTEITGTRKNTLYKQALALDKDRKGNP